jgi:hypothetical protein
MGAFRNALPTCSITHGETMRRYEFLSSKPQAHRAADDLFSLHRSLEMAQLSETGLKINKSTREC